MTIGEKIKALRENEGLTKTEFADKLNYRPQFIHYLEKCHKVNTNTLDHIAATFNKDLVLYFA